MRRSKYHLDPYSSPKTNRRGCLCKGKNTYSRKCCKGGLINQGIGEIVTFYPPKYVEPEGNPNGEIVVLTLQAGHFDNRGSNVDFEVLDLDGNLVTGTCVQDSKQSVLTRTGYLSSVNVTNGEWLYAGHGGRQRFTSITNNSGVNPQTPEGWPDYVTDINVIPVTEIGTIQPSTTWTGSVNLASIWLPQFYGDLPAYAPFSNAYVTLYQTGGNLTVDSYEEILAPAVVFDNGPI